MQQQQMQPAPVQGQVMMVAGVPEQAIQADSVNKTGACCFATASSLWMALWLIVVVLVSFVQFVIFSVVVPGMFFFFVVSMILSGVIGTTNCCFACCWGPSCSGYKICWDVTSTIMFFIIGIWGLTVVISPQFGFLSGTFDTENASDDEKKAYYEFNNALGSAEMPAGSGYSTVLEWLNSFAGIPITMMATALVGSVFAIIFGIYFKMKSADTQWCIASQGWMKYMPFGAHYAAAAMLAEVAPGKV